MIEQLAPGLNAFTCRFETKILDKVNASYDQQVCEQLERSLPESWHQGGHDIFGALSGSGDNYFAASYGTNPLMWISCDSYIEYERFSRFYQDLNIETDIRRLIDCKEAVEVFSGFFVVGRQANDTLWHVDYKAGAQAFTLITPLQSPSPYHGNLLYKDAAGETQTYCYQQGEAILFGPGFVHATEPYAPSEENRVLLSLTFGSDKKEHWELIEKTVGSQSRHLSYPGLGWRYNRLLPPASGQNGVTL